jgi:predicted RNase H-like HicB family nuclease
MLILCFVLKCGAKKFGEAESWSAVCPELPGCCSAGDTENEARQGIEEAIRLYLAV